MSYSTPVVFDYATWAATYPYLAQSVNSTQAAMYFLQAELYCDNTPQSIVDNCHGQRVLLLNMLVAHIALMNASINGQPPTALVGRISQATEGSVTVASEMNYAPGSAQWFMQTQPGAAYWQATARYRKMTYVPRYSAAPNPFPTTVIVRR
jgi:hypothetical protein